MSKTKTIIATRGEGTESDSLVVAAEPKDEHQGEGYWYKAYHSMEEAALAAQKRVDDLEAILRLQVNTNAQAGKKLESQDALMQERLAGHGQEMQGMAQEIMKLRAKVKELGGNCD